jgi:hypothetical protein
MARHIRSEALESVFGYNEDPNYASPVPRMVKALLDLFISSLPNARMPTVLRYLGRGRRMSKNRKMLNIRY